jgi:carbonic anhydrase
MRTEKIKEIATDWIRKQGWSEETLPSDEYCQMVDAFLEGFLQGLKQHEHEYYVKCQKMRIKIKNLEKEIEETKLFAERIVKTSADNPQEMMDLLRENEKLKQQLKN